MEQRNLLQPNTELRFYLKNGTSVTYVVQAVQGIGSLCVLYSAYYLDNLGLKKNVKIKEFNPVKFHLRRNQNLSFKIPEYEEEAFLKLKHRIVQSYHVSHQLFQTEHIANSISNAENIYEEYGTVYIVYAYMEGQDLAHYSVSSVSEAVRITKSVAKAVHKIHGAGFLYLDVKPENILVLDGTTDLIQLFDFDSLIPMNEKDNLMEVRITFSKGFSPVEQRVGDLANIGKHSDVYSIGALLFYLIYGVALKASDCNRKIPYRFEKSRFDFFHFHDVLGKEISRFLQKTLQSYIGDRYENMVPVIKCLEKIERLADSSREFVLTQIPSFKQELIGRKEEISSIRAWMKSPDPVLFITGMGGIGKSSVVCAAVQKDVDCFDAVSYMRYHGSMMETIADDHNLCLQNLEKDAMETLQEYAQRKISHVRKLCRENRILIVIDNYEGELSGELTELLHLGCKTLVVAREIETGHYPLLRIEKLQQMSEQKELFLYYLNRDAQEFTAEDDAILSEMIRLLDGHTLSVELLAKQIRASFLTLKEALTLIQKNGFSRVGEETVLYEKDGSGFCQTVYNVIASLYELQDVTESQRNLLKILSLSDIRGVDSRLFVKANRLANKEEINHLIRTGWISVNGECMYLHPLIREVLRNTAWDASGKQSVVRLIDDLQNDITTLAENRHSIVDSSLPKYLEYARMFLSDGAIRKIITPDQYDNLWCLVVANLERDEEAYILQCVEHIDVLLIHSDRTLLKLWDISIRIFCEAGAFDKAEEMLSTAKEYLSDKNSDEYAWAFYYGNMETEYYEYLLYAENQNVSQEQNITGLYEVKLYEANKKAILLSSHSKEENAVNLQARFVTDRINFLIRLGEKEDENLEELFAVSAELIRKMPYREPEIEISRYLAYMWYYTIFENDHSAAVQAWESAREISEEISYPDLEKIDALFVPGAEREVYFENYEQSVSLLNKGIELCESHDDAIPYLRKKEELQEHIQDVLSIKESS